MVGGVWRRLRSSFWFTPSMIVVVSGVLAIVLIEASTRMDNESLMRFPRLFGAGAEGSRGMLSTIAGSMMSIVGITFSMTLVALSLTSSQYSSRVLRNFMSSRVTQIALGAFLGIFTYCLIVLRTIRGGNEGAFVPALAVFVGVVLALGGVGVLIFFLHHIASSIQASSIISSVAEETLSAVNRLFPEELGEEEEETEESEGRSGNLGRNGFKWHQVPAVKNGYIQSVDVTELLETAERCGTVIRIDRAIGEFVIAGYPVVSMSGEHPPTQPACDAVIRSFAVSRYRTVDQDVGFGIVQIVDVALKALSTGVNDTTTAVTCIDYLTAILAQLAPRRIPDAHRYKNGELRAIVRGPGFGRLLELAFDQIRQSSERNVVVMLRILQSMGMLSTLTRSIHRREALRNQVQRIAELAERTVAAPDERELVQKAVLAALLEIQELPPSP